MKCTAALACVLALAMLLFGAAAAPMEDGRARKEELTARPRVARAFNRTTVSLALAVLSYLASLALYLSAGESFAVRALWLAGPLLLLVAHLPTRTEPEAHRTEPEAHRTEPEPDFGERFDRARRGLSRAVEGHGRSGLPQPAEAGWRIRNPT